MTSKTHTCRSESETMAIAQDIAQTLKGGEIFALTGDLGCGKTTFVKGLVAGLKSKTTVTSPTFNLVHRYQGGRLTVIHYDLYRLKKLEEIEALDLESEMDGNAVIAIEWPQIVEPILPKNRTFQIEFKEINPSERSVQIQSF